MLKVEEDNYKLQEIVNNLSKELDARLKSVMVLESELAKKKRSVFYLMSLLEEKQNESDKSE